MHRTLDIQQLEQPLVFVHIPKTAGTAFFRYLAANMPSRDCISPTFITDYEKIEWRNPAFKLFSGHFVLRKVKPLVPNGNFVTFLRHPAARIASLYRSWSDPQNLLPGDPWREAMTAEEIADIEFVQKASLEELLSTDRPNLVAGLADRQTYMLSNSTDRNSEIFLSSAKSNLEHQMVFFGIAEEFSESIGLFRRIFDHALDYAVPTEQENRSATRDLRFSRRAWARLEELNRNDIALYNYAMELFLDRCEAKSRPISAS